MGGLGVELHLHSVLSPCAGEEMIPPLVLRRGMELGLAFIAVTDHNSTLNVPAFWRAAQGLPIQVVPGIELQTREDIHLVGLFAAPEEAAAMQAVVDATLPKVKNREDFFGPQWIVDEEGRLIGVEDRLLLNSLDLSLGEAAAEIVRHGGVCIAAHVDRQAFGLLGVLGVIPAGLPLAALEVSRREALPALTGRLGERAGYPLVFASDAHYLQDMGRSITRVNHHISNPAGLIEALRRNAIDVIS